MQPALRPSLDEVWHWLSEVPDPEIPVISLTDLGIVRDVEWRDDTLVVTVTPTYSGCPATTIINLDIETALADKGLSKVKLERRLSPAWTTDWINDEGRTKLAEAGIAPPSRVGPAAVGPVPLNLVPPSRQVACPQCGSLNTSEISRFGSTACKALRRCNACSEPFEHVKEI